jgi:two-component system chemotaxis response regulator CheY
MGANPLTQAAVPKLALIAEPSVDTFNLYKTYLVPRRYVVEHAATGPEALAKALADPPDVMIVETQLPIIDGFALCALLREDPQTKRLPIVMIAADQRPFEFDRARRAGASAVLVKPCLPDVLFTELARLDEQPPRPADTHAVRSAANAHARANSRRYERYRTTTPPQAPPALRCPQCDGALQYEDSYVGGVTQKFAEQWDQFRCASGCGTFQYRHRTRRLRRPFC